MTRAGGKIPFPMPISGAVRDQHPFAVGIGGLVVAQNWVYQDGQLRTRDGVVALEPPLRWYEALELGQNLIEDGLADGSVLSTAVFNFGVGGPLPMEKLPSAAIVGTNQYWLYTIAEAYPYQEVTTNPITAEAGLVYTWWMLASETFEVGDFVMDFLNSDDEILESVDFEGDAIPQGVVIASSTAPPQTAGIRLRVVASSTRQIYFGPMKLVQGDEVVAWSAGDGYAGTVDENLFAMEVAHPENGDEAQAIWNPTHGKESIVSYQGGGVLGLFDGYDTPPIAGRSVAYSAQPKKLVPLEYEITGIGVASAYRVAGNSLTSYKMSASAFFDVEGEEIPGMTFSVEAVFVRANGTGIGYETICSVTSSEINIDPVIEGGYRVRGEATFTPPQTTAFIGVRARCNCPTADREEIYDTDGNIIYTNYGEYVTTDAENKRARRLGIVIDDVKLVAAAGADARWYDFRLPVITHDGLPERSEYPMSYLLHDYLFEGATESDRIVMASNKSLWKWNDTTDEWDLTGFDLGTIYSAFYLIVTDDDDEESFTLDERFAFEQTEDEGYTAGVGEEEELTIEIELPAATEASETPAPGGWWRYRVNGGDWSSQHDLAGDTPVKTAMIEYNSRELPVKINLDVIDNEDFADVCVIPEGEEDDFPNPIFRGTIVSRHHDEEAGETVFNTDRDGPVDMRGYDYGQKTYVICANGNDRVVAWDGQSTSKAERAGQNAPFAKTICISGGRVLAGNVRFADPYTDLVAPLAVVYSDTFLSQGFRNWHPELAIRLADTAGEIVKLLEMGTLAVAAYKTDAAYMLVYQTGNNPFRTQLMASSIAGPVSVRACTPLTENTHMYLGNDGGIHVFDGSYPRDFSPTISATIQSELDLNYKERAFLAFTPRLNVALAMYPTKGSDGRVNRGMYIDIARQAGWPFEWDGSIFDFTGGAAVKTIDDYEVHGVTIRMNEVASALASGQVLQPDFFFGDTSGVTYAMDEAAQDDAGEAILARLRSGLTEFGGLDQFHILKEIEFIINRTNHPHTLDVEIWSSDYGIDAKPVAHDAINLFADGPYASEIREKGRFWGYGLDISAFEHVVLSGAYASVAGAGRRKV